LKIKEDPEDSADEETSNSLADYKLGEVSPSGRFMRFSNVIYKESDAFTVYKGYDNQNVCDIVWIKVYSNKLTKT